MYTGNQRCHVRLSACCLLLAGCNSGNALEWSEDFRSKKLMSFTNTVQTNSSEDKLLNEDTVISKQIGNGYDSRTRMPKMANCFANNTTANNLKFRNLIGSIDFAHTLSSLDLSSLTNMNITGKTGFGWFSASASAKFMRDTNDTRHSEYFNYAQTFAADVVYDIPNDYGAKILNPGALQALDEGPEQFNRFCGDSFLASGSAGAVLLASVGIEFNSASDKSHFDSSFAGGVSGIASVTAQFEKATDSKKVNAMLVFRALQLGGDPTKLANIFGNDNFNGDYAVVSCKPNTDNEKTNTANCKNIINAVIKYAQTDFQNGLNLKDKQSLHFFGTHYEKWLDYGVRIMMPDLTRETLDAQDYAVNQIQEDRENLAYLEKYLQSPVNTKLNTITVSNIKETIANYKKLITMYDYYNILSMCYGKDVNNTCPPAAKYILDEHMKFDKSGHNYVAKALRPTYIDWGGGRVLVSANEGNVNNITQKYAYGAFIMHNPYLITNTFANTFDFSGLCLVDFSPGNEYFKSYYPQLVGKFIQCWSNGIGTPSEVNFYVWRKRIINGNGYGLAGKYINGSPVNYSLQNGQDYNVVFNYFNDLYHNPI